jgi:hypothetical protein
MSARVKHFSSALQRMHSEHRTNSVDRLWSQNGALKSPQTTLDLYTQEDQDETRAAQGQFLKALGMPAGAVQ